MGILNGDIFGPDEMFRFMFWPTLTGILIILLITTYVTRRPW